MVSGECPTHPSIKLGDLACFAAPSVDRDVKPLVPQVDERLLCGNAA